MKVFIQIIVFILLANYGFSQRSFYIDLVSDSPCEPLFVKGNKTNTEFSVYPIPSKDVIFINSHHDEGHIELYDITGRLIYVQEHNSFKTKINIENLRPGMYILIFFSDKKSYQTKIIKE
jgi:hypothetical protein